MAHFGCDGMCCPPLLLVSSGDCWILEGVFCLFSAGMHSGSLLAVASKVSAAVRRLPGGLCIRLGAKATERVDVPETPNFKDMEWSSKKKQKLSKVSRSSCALSRVVTTSCLALQICFLLIFMNKLWFCLVCLVISSCWFTETK